jgi:hypothetical protein
MPGTWLEYDQLEMAMRGQSTLEGFDVLVSYNETELNNVLKAATDHDNITAIKVPEFTTSVTGQCELLQGLRLTKRKSLIVRRA